MARPRINQFADDLSISRSQAVNLINKGRSKKDGGSQVLENNMNKMKGYKKGGRAKFNSGGSWGLATKGRGCEIK